MLSKQAEMECTLEMLRLEIQKLQVLVDDITQDFIEPLRGAVERQEQFRVDYLVNCESFRASVRCMLCNDVIDNARHMLGEVFTLDDATNKERHAGERGAGNCGEGETERAC